MPDLTITSRPMATDYFTGSPSPVRDVSYSITGIKGSTRYFYWVVANYSWGSVAPIAPLIVANAPDVLGVTGSVVLSWIQPSSQIVSYTVLRTTIPVFPGSSTTAVGSATLTATTITDSGAALVAATFTAIPAMRGVIYIDGTGPIPVLISNIGMQVSGSLSATGPVTASAFNVVNSSGSLPSWKAYTVTLIGSNWQVIGPDGTVTLVPTAAALTQNIPVGTLPPNSYLTFARIELTAGPVGGTPTAASVAGVIRTPGDTVSIPVGINLKLSSIDNVNNFADSLPSNNVSPGNSIINTQQTLAVIIQTTGGNISTLAPPCSFVIYLLWGVTN